MVDVFISYSRKDKSFVEKLVNALKDEGKDVWIDFEDIPFAAGWWEEICGGIEAAETSIFVISPDSVGSRVCGMEIDYIQQNRKRLIPILYREVPPGDMPPSITHLNWIDFQQTDRFAESAAKLGETLNTDLEMLRRHTRLLMRARDWERKGHSPSLLLRGDDLDDMLSMLDQHNLIDLQRTFLTESIKRRQRSDTILRFEFGFIGGFLGMAFWAFAVFMSPELITPRRFIYSLSLGQAFGLFTALLALLGSEAPVSYLKRWLSPPVLKLLRAAGCLVISVLAWMVFRWLYLEYPTLSDPDRNTILLGGVGLAFGFILRILFTMPGWLAALITAIATYIPIYVTSNLYWSGQDDLFQPLVHVAFAEPNERIFTVGIPIVLFIAAGANARALWREARNLYQRLRPQPAAVPVAAEQKT